MWFFLQSSIFRFKVNIMLGRSEFYWCGCLFNLNVSDLRNIDGVCYE